MDGIKSNKVIRYLLYNGENKYLEIDQTGEISYSLCFVFFKWKKGLIESLKKKCGWPLVNDAS